LVMSRAALIPKIHFAHAVHLLHFGPTLKACL
jgi:hypothetical protein